MIIIHQFYAAPLNDEALECEVGVEMIKEQQLLRAGGGLVRRVRVLTVEDSDAGRDVTFELLSKD